MIIEKIHTCTSEIRDTNNPELKLIQKKHHLKPDEMFCIVNGGVTEVFKIVEK